jgi:hypothetical protein
LDPLPDVPANTKLAIAGSSELGSVGKDTRATINCGKLAINPIPPWR